METTNKELERAGIMAPSTVIEGVVSYSCPGCRQLTKVTMNPHPWKDHTALLIKAQNLLEIWKEEHSCEAPH